MRNRLLTRVTALALATGLVTTGLAVLPEHELQEDDPGWNCRTMGHRDCGFLDSDDARTVILVHFDEDGEPVGMSKRRLPETVKP
ncbi:MAG: hypothetical protein ABIQ18_21565 [Umezawaea sp.]